MLDSRTVAMDEGVKIWRMRLRIFWITSVGVTIFFLFFVFIMMMVPGVLWNEKVWMLSIAATAVAVPIAIGIWRFGTTEAPILKYPLGPIVCVLLLLEEAECFTSIFILLLRKTH
jgi:Kef-type K+ transport system membrane component KefB